MATSCAAPVRAACWWRLGKDKDAWALKIPGIAPMVMRGRQMNGWVRAAPEMYSDDAIRQTLLEVTFSVTHTRHSNISAPSYAKPINMALVRINRAKPLTHAVKTTPAGAAATGRHP